MQSVPFLLSYCTVHTSKYCVTVSYFTKMYYILVKKINNPSNKCSYLQRIVWRYQRCNHNPYIEEEQTTSLPKEKVQSDTHRFTKHTYKTKDRVTRTPLTTGGELRCSGKVGYYCSTRGLVNLVTNPVISREWGKCLGQVEHIRCHLWHIYSITVNQVMVATVTFSKGWLQLDKKESLVQ